MLKRLVIVGLLVVIACGANADDKDLNEQLLKLKPNVWHKRIYELSGEPRVWSQAASGPTIPGWGHDNCTYEAKHKKLVVFGGNKNSNDIVVYDPAAKEIKVMPTPGERPPRDQHNPMEFEPNIGKTVVLVDRTKAKDKADKDTTETWCYDLGADVWSEVKTAKLPFALSMNYNMEYDPHHKVLLLVTGGYGRPTAVWALTFQSKSVDP